jgi:hypothetical protein
MSNHDAGISGILETWGKGRQEDVKKLPVASLGRRGNIQVAMIDGGE